MAVTYPSVNQVLRQLSDHIAEAELLREIRIQVLTGFDNLFETIPELTLFPAAILFAGSIDTDHQGANRNIEISMILIDTFRTGDEKTTAAHELLDALLTVLSSSSPGAPLCIGDVHYCFYNVRPLDLPDTGLLAWQLTFEAKTACVFNL